MAKKDSKPDILFISGSPRIHTCVALIDLLEQGAKNAGARTQRFLLAKKHIDPCIGCGSCSKTGTCILAGKTVNGHFTDDYLELKAVIDRVDAVAVVSPVFFAGPPSQLKALYDRMQPYWAQRYYLGYPAREKRPAQLFMVGGGHDPHGFQPLITTTKSALAVAGFNLEKINNFIGFCAPRDVPTYPSDEDAFSYSHGDLARTRRQIALQEDFVQRALDAGGAFARFVVKKKQAQDLATQLAKVQAEMEDLKKVGDPDKPAAQTAENPPSTRASSAEDRKVKLRAGIDLDYRNLISRTGKEHEQAPADEMLNEEFDGALSAEGNLAHEELLEEELAPEGLLDEGLTDEGAKDPAPQDGAAQETPSDNTAQNPSESPREDSDA